MRAMAMSSRQQRQRKVQHETPMLRGGAHDGCAVQPAHFTIPLKPQDKPANFPAHFAHAVKEEYAIKYLAKIGAHPTAENIATVLENLPLEECHIATAWKSRGSLSDVITIDLYPHARPDVRKQAEVSHSGSSQGVKNSSGDAARVSRSEQDYRSRSTSNNQHERQASLSAMKPYHVGPVCLSFDDMKRQFLLPFKHGAKDEVDILSTFGMKHDEPVEFVTIPALATSGIAAVHLLGRRATQRRVKCMEERVIVPEVKPDVVLQMQKSFYGALPLAALGIREEHEKLSLYEAVVDVKVTLLVQSLVRYMYHQVFVKLACASALDLINHQHTSSASPEEVELLYVATIRVFAKLKHQLAFDEENGIRLYLPLLLLELRVAVETAYRIQYPVSFSVTGPTMQYILMQMDNAITKLLDPDEHLSRIGVLETTCESTKIMASHPFQVKRRQLRLRDQFFKTSEALHSIFPRPQAGKGRKIIKLCGGASVANYPPHLEPPPDFNNRDSEELTSRQGAHAQEERSSGSADGDYKNVSVGARLELLRIIERKGRRNR